MLAVAGWLHSRWRYLSTWPALMLAGRAPPHPLSCSVKKSVAQQPPLPVPTLLEAAGEVTVAPKSEGDPYAYRE